MPTSSRKRAATAKPPEHDDPAGVDALLAASDHPLVPVVRSVRKAILGADKAITEGVKWNSPSFYSAGWFATVNTRGRHGVLLVLHLGARSRADAKLRETIEDDAGLLHWHSADRASISLADEADFAAKRRALIGIVRQWARTQRELARTG